MAQRLLDATEAAEVVRGIEDVEASLGEGTRQRYYRLAQQLVDQAELRDLSFGLDREVLAAILNTLPVELSFIDHEDRVRYFSHEHGEKIFGRTRGAIGTAVQDCHPPKSLHLVRQIITDFKAGVRDVAEFWIAMGGRAHGAHPLLAGTRRGRPLPGHARDRAGRERHPPDGRREAPPRSDVVTGPAAAAPTVSRAASGPEARRRPTR